MKRVTGLGGAFFKANDPEKMGAWYREHLGIRVETGGYAIFEWRDKDNPEKPGSTVWAAFPRDTDYFSPGDSSFMFNFRVADLEGLLAQLQSEGVWVDDRRTQDENGRFGWIRDSEGNRIELWEPAEGR